MAHRKAMFKFGAARGMNTYLYAPKDDPYHRERWTEPYPRNQWQALLQLIRQAQARRIDFVYGFHPGKGLCFSDKTPVRTLLAKAQPILRRGRKNVCRPVRRHTVQSRLRQGSQDILGKAWRELKGAGYKRFKQHNLVSGEMSNGGFVLPTIPPTLCSRVSSVGSNQTFWKS